MNCYNCGAPCAHAAEAARLRAALSEAEDNFRAEADSLERVGFSAVVVKELRQWADHCAAALAAAPDAPKARP